MEDKSLSKIPVRCPKCRSRDITVVGTSNCTCGNCGEEFICQVRRM